MLFIMVNIEIMIVVFGFFPVSLISATPTYSFLILADFFVGCRNSKSGSNMKYILEWILAGKKKKKQQQPSERFKSTQHSVYAGISTFRYNVPRRRNPSRDCLLLMLAVCSVYRKEKCEVGQVTLPLQIRCFSSRRYFYNLKGFIFLFFPLSLHTY